MPFMIFLPGIQLRDYDLVYAKKASSIVSEITSMPDKILAPVPHVFTSRAEWPRAHGNVSCAYCDVSIVDQPLFIPIHIDANSMYIRGTFCDFHCLLAYVKTHRNYGENYVQNVYHLYTIWHGETPKYIPEAPDRMLLTRYGGNLSLQEFYGEISKHIDKNHVAPSVPLPLSIISPPPCIISRPSDNEDDMAILSTDF